MTSSATIGELSDVPDDFGAKYLGYEPTLRQKQRAHAFNNCSYLHLLKILFQSTNVLNLCGKMFHSMRKSEAPHTINIDVDTTEKKVIEAHCTCKAGVGGKCAHVLALVTIIESWKIRGLKAIPAEPSCTSVPQQWDKPRGPKILPEPVAQMTISNPVNNNRKRKPVMATFIDNRKIQVEEIHINILRSLSVAPISYLVSTPSLMVDAGATQQPLAPLITPLQQPRPKGADQCGNIDFPKPILCMALHVLEQLKTHWEHLEISMRNCIEIEKSTRAQSENDNWFKERQKRITASNFGPIMVRKTDITEKFIKNLFDKKSFTSAPTTYGKANEKTAKQLYIKATGNHIHDTGLIVNPLFPFLGATPDAKVCEQGVTGIIEVKCPYSVRDMTIDEACKNRQDFFLEKSGHSFQLKKDHPYWFQVQRQLLISGAPYCDFVTYTKHEINTQRIYACLTTMIEILSKLSKVYVYHFKPYFAAKNI